LSIKYLIFDLDNTLYSPDSGLLNQIDRNIELFLTQKFQLPPSEITEIRHQYWINYGTTLEGLIRHHQICPEEYFQCTYDVNVGDFLTNDFRLQQMLQEIDLPKVIFSNSPKYHVNKVLQELGIGNCFSKVYDIIFCEYQGKPNLTSYQRVLADLNITPAECIFVDDTLSNIEGASSLGITSIWINPSDEQQTEWSLTDIYELPKLIAEILENRKTA